MAARIGAPNQVSHQFSTKAIPMARVLVACEYSGIAHDAFVAAGHEAMSCDLLPSETPGEHYQGDILDCLCESGEFDLIVADPPCTYLAVSGNRWYAGTTQRQDALEWTGKLWAHMSLSAEKLALENPVGVLASIWSPADQYIQPWQFGHPETKKTGLWLHNLPPLVPTHDKPDHIEERVWRMPPGPDRQKERSRFFPGIAKAMAEQWGPLLGNEWRGQCIKSPLLDCFRDQCCQRQESINGTGEQ